tara:strand:+ start:399 stop:515 length:117 start_codon:yes stop_codon:yes gene_type:complete
MFSVKIKIIKVLKWQDIKVLKYLTTVLITTNILEKIEI